MNENIDWIAYWQPIEVAPKNPKGSKVGPSILIWDGRAVGIAQWQVINRDGKTGWWRYQAGPEDAAFDDYDAKPFCDDPTHWMPLPAPPTDR